MITCSTFTTSSRLTVVSANKVTIGTGELVMQGRHVSQGTPEDLIVTNGSQGQKRNDLIVCRYTKGSQSVESAELVVVRGTPTTGTPTDPTLNTTSPLDGGTTYDMPLYRIPLDGITIGTPVPLFNVLRPMSDVWDSLTHATSVQSRAWDTSCIHVTPPIPTVPASKSPPSGRGPRTSCDAWRITTGSRRSSGCDGTPAISEPLPASWRPPMDLNFLILA